MVALTLAIAALSIAVANLAVLARRNRKMFGRYFPPGPKRRPSQRVKP